MQIRGMTRSRAYDESRKKFYKLRHFEDVERRIAKEEALHSGAYFGLGPNAVSEKLENAKFEKWKVWATERATLRDQQRMAGYSGADSDSDSDELSLKLDADMEETLVDKSTLPEALPKNSQDVIANAVDSTKRRF